MEAKTKQRIIGGIVLVAVLAIFLPVLFHHSHPSMNLALSTEVPKAPAQPQVELQLPTDDTGTVNRAVPNNVDVDKVASTPSQSAEAAEKTPTVTQKILNTPPAPAPATVTPSSVPDNTATSSSNSTAATTPSPPPATPNVSQSFIVQVASFANPDNAVRLMKQLRKEGMDAHAKKSVGITRVYIGPVNSQVKAVQLQQKLMQRMHLRGVIRKNT